MEIEYMIVDKKTMDVRPFADKVLVDDVGELQDELFFSGENMAWSNELAMHVLELKVPQPVRSLAGIDKIFHAHVLRANKRLAEMGAQLLPGAMHFWMNPDKDFCVWPHGNKDIYNTYDRIFNCKGHGWSNLQSSHINFPFADDKEFARLHAAIRAIICLTPAISASSPFLEEKLTGLMDTRMEVYRGNAAKIPSIAGFVVPDPMLSEDEYERLILQPIYNDLINLDPQGVLRHEWVNSRGCIARFDRGAIELRTLDAQESPLADIAVISLVRAAVMALCTEKWCAVGDLNKLTTYRLHELMLRCIKDADRAIIDDQNFLECIGISDKSMQAGDIWKHLFSSLKDSVEFEYRKPIEKILTRGTLARFMLTRDMRDMTREMMTCLAENRIIE